jgi:double-stranded uracil-DNA glycosylase
MSKPVHSFSFVADARAKVLVLGTMPGAASLTAGQYYAHPRNMFWRIAGEVFNFDPGQPYEARLEALRRNRVALWDVMHSCNRPGSLDADIVRDSVVANDFAGFFAQFPAITRVCFNGSMARQVYERQVKPRLAPLRLPLGLPLRLEYIGLPSTSPANAAVPLSTKLERWRVALVP